MTLDKETVRQLARESGRILGQLGVRPEDDRWIQAQAETLASLAGSRPPRRWLAGWLYRLGARSSNVRRERGEAEARAGAQNKP